MLEIKNYKSASDIPEEYLPSLVDSEIECWWAEPFAEYKICGECSAIYSIEDEYLTIENYRNRKKDWDFICECWCETNLMYPKDKYIDMLVKYIKWEVMASLLLDDNRIEGFWISTKSNFKNIIYNEMDSRPDSYNKDKVIKLISQKIFNIDNAEDKEFLYSNQVYVTPSLRSWNESFNMLRKIFNMNSQEYKNLPIIWETKYKSKFYPISRIIWYQDIDSDKYWNVLQYSWCVNDVAIFFDNYDSFKNKELFRYMFRYKKESNIIMKENPSFLNRIFYK